MKSKIIVKQHGIKDCGVACLLSIIRYYGGDISHEELGYLIKCSSDGVNAYSMIEGSKKIGLNGYGISINFYSLVNDTISLPVIAHVISNNMTHFVVIYKINYKKQTIKIMDPNYGFINVSYNQFEKIFLNTIIYFYPEKIIPKINQKNNFFKYIVRNIFSLKKFIIWIIILSVLTIFFTIINNLYLKIFIDYLIKDFSIKFLLLLFSIFFLVIISKNIFEYLRGKILIKINKRLSLLITNEATRHIFCLPYAYFKNKPTGEIISRISDLENFKNLFSNIILNIFVDILLIIFSSISLLFINKKLFILALSLIILYFLVSLIYSFIFKNRIRDIEQTDGEYNNHITEYIEGYESIKNLNMINSIIYKLKIKYNSLLFKIKDFECKYNNSLTFKNLINDIGLLLINCIGIYFVFKNDISIGDLVIFNTLVLYFTEPLKQILDLEPNIRYAITAYERINDLILLKEEETNSEDNSLINGSICIKNLIYSYNYIDNVLSIKELVINKTDKILLYGKSGNGKSTLIKILLKYVEEYQGIITINNINLLDINKNTLRNSFTYISQNERLFCDNIKNNIIFDRNINDSDFKKIVNICKVNKIIDKKKNREKYLIEENGFNLSGGERQKIILARGLLKTGNYIVLDEALSEVDFNDEKEIIKNICEEFKDKTIIYISHKKEIIELFKTKFFINERREDVN